MGAHFVVLYWQPVLYDIFHMPVMFLKLGVDPVGLGVRRGQFQITQVFIALLATTVQALESFYLDCANFMDGRLVKLGDG